MNVREAAAGDRDLPCRDLVELATDYLDGALESAVADAVRRHLELCPACVEYLRQIRHTVRLIGELPPGRLTKQVQLRLLAAFRESRPPGSRTPVTV